MRKKQPVHKAHASLRRAGCTGNNNSQARLWRTRNASSARSIWLHQQQHGGDETACTGNRFDVHRMRWRREWRLMLCDIRSEKKRGPPVKIAGGSRFILSPAPEAVFDTNDMGNARFQVKPGQRNLLFLFF